jgi:chromosome segregation protein
VQISKLRLSGFKSFVQPTELYIEAGLTGIVGPNGCGKSNLVDALRWVMGESSARGLRGGEMDDVIFAGTNARAAYDLAEVALQIHANGSPIAGFEGEDELELTRRIGRGMGSVYRVNGKEMRARDIQLLFADAASGARSAAIVSQGRIGALVEAKPTDRRKLLEEAAGIGGLQARRHEAELKLQAAEANLLRVDDLLVTLDEQFLVLQKQAREAERYRKLSAQHRDTEAALLIGRWRIAQAELARAETALREGKGHVQVYAGRIAAARDARERAGTTLTSLRREAAQTETELARQSERLNAIDAEAARLDANQTRLREQERQTVQDLGHAEAAAEDAGGMVSKLQGERQAVLALVEEGAEEVEALGAAAAEAATALTAAEAVFRERLAARAAVEARTTQIEERAARIAAEQQALTAGREELDGQLRGLAEAPARFAPGEPADQVEAALGEALAANEAAEARLAAAEAERAACQEHLAGAVETLKQAEDRLREKREQLREADSKRRAASERGRELASRIERLRAREAEIETKAAARERDRAALDVDAAAARLAEVEGDLAGRDTELDAARAALAEHRASAEEATAALRARQAAIERLEAEAAALDALKDDDEEGPGVLDLVEVEDGYADALGAALGDDLLGGLDSERATHWRDAIGAAPLPAAAALPEGVTALSSVVKAPAALGRRLAQVGLVAAGDAARLQAALAAGQRLVSTEGGLWRWDGLVRRPEGGRSAAARLRQQARRRELEAELEAAGLAHADAGRVAAAAALEAGEAEALLQQLEAGREAERLTLEAARETLAGLRAEAQAIGAELGPLGEERERLAGERAELETQQAGLDQELAESPAAAGDAADLVPLDAAVTAARAEHEAARDADQAAQIAQKQAREDVALTRRRAADCRERLERCRAEERRQEAVLREQAVEQAQLEARLARLAEDEAALASRHGDNNEAENGVRADLDAVDAALREAEETLGLARGRHADASARQAGLRDRQATATQRAAQLQAEHDGWQARIEAQRQQVDALIERRKRIVVELADLEGLLADLVRQQTELRAKLEAGEAKRAELAAKVEAAEQALAEAEAALTAIETEQLEARESGARLEAHLDRAQAEAAAAEAAVHARLGESIETLPGEPPTPEALAELEIRLARLDASRERLGAVNLRAIEEAKELEMRVQNLRQEQDELAQAIERLRRAISTLNREARDRLRQSFKEVEQHFEAVFVRLFGGGRAKLELTDMEDPLNAGLELAASPPGKKLQSLSLLSGGEKALTALALIFAVFLTRPAPLCLLDEVDAPLDDANVTRLVNMLDEVCRTTETRFVVVTHHPLTMARMDRLFGVTMVERGVSQLVGVDLRTAVELRATA